MGEVNATLVLENWPAGYRASFYGYSQDPDSTEWDDWPYYVETDGSQYLTGGITIPRTATPGARLCAPRVLLGRQRQRSRPARLLSGVHAGRVAPLGQTRGRGAAQRRDLRPGPLGKRAGRREASDRLPAHAGGRADGFGRYHTGSLRPQRTTWYIARYPGDDWYWRGYTAVTKVTVR